MTKTVLVLGANGRLGRAALLAFADAGWQVRAQLRRPPRAPLPPGVQLVQCDALDVATLTAAGHGAQVIVNALNPDYTRWATLLPPIAGTEWQIAQEVLLKIGPSPPSASSTFSNSPRPSKKAVSCSRVKSGSGSPSFPAGRRCGPSER